MDPQKSFLENLETLINQHSMENGSNTPDFILAHYLGDCLRAFNAATKERSKWYGHDKREGNILECEVPGLPNVPDPK